ncbi:MAG: hypothetical protein JNL80_10945 [Phycisphaerae bacterium]|jgi:hypothetical protein|nr:hypothetical protein [Phycisphaerae bacterium]
MSHSGCCRGWSFVAGALLSATAFMLAGANRQTDILPAVTTIDEEPVLFWDVAGYGLGGPIHERLAIYSNGLVTYAYGGWAGDDGAACFTYVAPESVTALAHDLRKAGVFGVKDSAAIVSDVPTTTVTAFRSLGNGESRAATFSFTSPTSDVLVEISAIVNRFRDEHLPAGGCSGSGG